MTDVETVWREQRRLLAGEHPTRAFNALWSWLGSRIGYSSGFDFFLRTVSQGLGCGDDGGAILLPVNVLEDAAEEGRIDLAFLVEIRLTGWGEDSDHVARMSVQAFLFYASVAVVLHATHVNRNLDPYAVIERLRAACTPESQFALVSKRDKAKTGLNLATWQREWNAGA